MSRFLDSLGVASRRSAARKRRSARPAAAVITPPAPAHVPSYSLADSVAAASVGELREWLADGRIDKTELRAAELAGKRRRTVLDYLAPDDEESA